MPLCHGRLTCCQADSHAARQHMHMLGKSTAGCCDGVPSCCAGYHPVLAELLYKPAQPQSCNCWGWGALKNHCR